MKCEKCGYPILDVVKVINLDPLRWSPIIWEQCPRCKKDHIYVSKEEPKGML